MGKGDILWTTRKSPAAVAARPPSPKLPRLRPLTHPLCPPKASPPSCCRHKDRSPEEHKALLNRLSRIEGQVRGIRGMLEKDAYCVDILVQVAAANSALNSFSKELLAQHISTCVADDLRAGSEAKLDELVNLLPKLMK
ncbi:MAG: metal-sensing transcriptional repressor [Faecalibacterium sp.]